MLIPEIHMKMNSKQIAELKSEVALLKLEVTQLKMLRASIENQHIILKGELGKTNREHLLDDMTELLKRTKGDTELLKNIADGKEV